MHKKDKTISKDCSYELCLSEHDKALHKINGTNSY